MTVKITITRAEQPTNFNVVVFADSLREVEPYLPKVTNGHNETRELAPGETIEMYVHSHQQVRIVETSSGIARPIVVDPNLVSDEDC